MAEGDEWQKGVGCKEAKDEAEEMGVVVYPGQSSQHQKDY